MPMNNEIKTDTTLQEKTINKIETSCHVSVSLLGIAQICSWGTLYYSFPQLAVAIENDMNWDKSELYSALTLGLLLSALSSISMGVAIDKGYGRNVMAGGSVLAGLLLVAGSQINSLLWFYVVFAGIGFLHAATLYDAAFSVIAKNFNIVETKRYISSITLWGGFAATIFIPLIELALNQWSWRIVMIILGGVNLTICTAIYLTLPSQSTCLKNMEILHKSSKPKPVRSVSWALKQPIFWALLFCFMLFATTTTAFKFHLYPMLLEKGLSLKEVVTMVAILGPAQVAGRLVLVVFSNRFSMSKLGVLVSLILPIVFAAFAFLPIEFWILVPFAVAFGAATGTMTIIKGIAVPEFLTPSSYGAINGAMNMPVKVVKAFAPSIAAYLWFTMNGYDWMLNILIFLGIGVVFFFALASQMVKPIESNEETDFK